MSGRRFQFVIDCPLPRAVVFEAMTDFSEKRAEYFPNLSRKSYRVLESGDKSALVREGTGPFFTQERYDWSTDGRIWSVIEESNVGSAGRHDRREDHGALRRHMPGRGQPRSRIRRLAGPAASGERRAQWRESVLSKDLHPDASKCPALSTCRTFSPEAGLTIRRHNP